MKETGIKEENLPDYLKMKSIYIVAAISAVVPPLSLAVMVMLYIRNRKVKKIDAELMEEYNKLLEKQNFVDDILSKKEKIQKEIDGLEDELNSEKKKIQKEIDKFTNKLNSIKEDVFYEYIDPNDYSELESEEIANKLSLLRLEQKEMIKSEEMFDSLPSENKAFVNNLSKKMLRTLNSEADQIIKNVTVKNVDSSRNKLVRSFEQINKLYSKDDIAVSKSYLDSKLEEMNLIYNYELKKEQEKEIQRAIKEQMVEEEKLRKEIENEKKKIEKEERQFKGEVDKLMSYLQKTDDEIEKKLYADKIRELEEKINLLEKDKDNVLKREQNTRAGFVYIISNIGSFGEDIYKIGMTRRLEPMDRVKELSSASVPFSFDVHAMIFSEDAPTLENELHKSFREYEVNKINPRKEFFKVSLDQIETVVKEKYNNTVEFVKSPKFSEYLESLNVKESTQ